MGVAGRSGTKPPEPFFHTLGPRPAPQCAPLGLGASRPGLCPPGADSQGPWCAGDRRRVSKDRCLRRGLGAGLKQAERAVACNLYPSSLFCLLLKELISDPSSAGGLFLYFLHLSPQVVPYLCQCSNNPSVFKAILMHPRNQFFSEESVIGIT